MKTLILVLMVVMMLIPSIGFCTVKYIDPYIRSDGTPVRGHYRDTSNDGNPYNNANYNGMNSGYHSGSGYKSLLGE